MLVPMDLGGNEVDLQTFLDVVELISEGNGAAGWDVATSSWNSLIALTLPPDGSARIYVRGPDIAFAGGFAGGGRASATEGGYRITGHWSFGSGCAEADWMVAGGCRVFDGDIPRLGANEQPELRFALFPRDAVTVHDTWRVSGLQGTGSHDWSVTDAYVPEPLTQLVRAPSSWPGTLHRLPIGSVINAPQFSAVATGIARRAINGLVKLAKTKSPMGSGGLLRERVQVQDAVARAEALLESARAYRSLMVADVWATAAAKEPVSVQQRARLRLAGTHATESAVEAVNLMFQAGGTTSTEDASPLSHCFRDVHVVAQNINVLPLRYENVGRVFLDLDSGTPLI